MSETPVTHSNVPATPLLGVADDTPYHRLALDPSGDGFWAAVERISFHVSDRLSPILVKETRESLKSRQFLITFLLLLGLTLLWTCLGVVFNSPDIYYAPSGQFLLTGYYVLLAIAIAGLVPLMAYRSLSSELENNTFELLSVTELGSLEIIRGKFASATLQMMLYLAAVMPSLAFTYLLRGVSVLEIAMILIAIMLSGVAITALALMVAPLQSGFLSQTMVLIGLIIAIGFVQIVLGSICLAGVLQTGLASGSDGWVGVLMAVPNLGVIVVILLKTAAAQIAPVSENRSTSIRCWLVVLQTTWVTSVVVTMLYTDDRNVVNFGSFWLTLMWLVVGAIFLTESTEISPRVRRGLPATLTSRALLTAFVPGPSSGYLFAVCTGSVSILSLGLFGTLVGTSSSVAIPIAYSFFMASYLACFLGLTRLVTLPFVSRNLVSLPLSLGVLVGWVLAASIAPYVLSVLLTGFPSTSSSDFEVLNPIYTAVDRMYRSLPLHLAIVPLFVGLVISLINFAFMHDLYKYRRVAVPRRVTEDLAQQTSADPASELSA